MQIVSTNEAVLDRRLAEVPAGGRDDLTIEITPREYIPDYLVNSFPTQLHTVFADEDGNPSSIPAVDERGNPTESREAAKPATGWSSSCALCRLYPAPSISASGGLRALL